MSYEVRCDCGKAHAVTAADAGSALSCTCGRTVDVPALHMLRAAAGEQPISPAMQIQGMLLRGELPGTNVCANCGSRTENQIRVLVVCEQVTTESEIGPASYLLGCFFGWIGLAMAWIASQLRPGVQRGRHVAFTLPVCVCETCAADTSPAALKKDLRATPVYADLLDQYPDATVARLE